MDFFSIAKLGLSAISLLSKPKEDKSGRLDLGRLRADAKANGFNPLTVLQSTGGAGFTTGAQIPSFLSLAASNANSMLSTFEQSQAAARSEARQVINDQVSNDLIRAQTNNLDVSRSQFSSGSSAPVIGPYGPSAASSSMSRPVAYSTASQYVLGDASLGPLGVGGFAIAPDQGWSNAEDYEARWGEVGGSLMGLGVLAADGIQYYKSTDPLRRRSTISVSTPESRVADTLAQNKREEIAAMRSAGPILLESDPLTSYHPSISYSQPPLQSPHFTPRPFVFSR